MQISDYLRLQFQNDRQRILYGEYGLKGVIRASKKMTTDAYSSIDGYISCFISAPPDTYRELTKESKRVILSILSIFRYRDVIQRMLYLYFAHAFHATENDNAAADNRESPLPPLATAPTLAYSLSETLAASERAAWLVVGRVSKKLPASNAAFRFLALEQHMVRAARQLQSFEPGYYNILYDQQLEMMYYFVELLLSEIIETVQIKGEACPEDICHALVRKFNV